MDEHKPMKRPDWPEERPPGRIDKIVFYALLIALIVVIVLAAFLLIHWQAPPIFNNVNNDV